MRTIFRARFQSFHSFSRDRITNILETFEVNESCDVVSRRKRPRCHLAMLQHPFAQTLVIPMYSVRDLLARM
jgi:hypothetical protein